MMKSVKTVALFTSVTEGGTWRYVAEMVEQWRKQKVNTLLIHTQKRILYVDFWNADRHDSFIFPYAEDMQFICELLRSYKVGLIHYQHTLNTELNLLKLAKLMDIPYVVTLHDYYLICPFIKLSNENGTYCCEKGNEACQKCLNRRSFYSKSFKKPITDITFWHHFWGNFLSNASSVIVPNEDVKIRFSKYYPNANYRVIENPELNQPIMKSHEQNKRIQSGNDGMIHVGILGILSIGKGKNVLINCAKIVQSQNLPVHFILFGELANYNESVPETLNVLGRYKEEEIYDLIKRENIDFFWFPAICPETYSYTLSIPIRVGIPVIGTNLGAIAERIHRHHWGETYGYTELPEKIVERLIDFSKVKDQYTDLQVTNTTYPSAEDYYLVGIDKMPFTISAEKSAELKRKEIYEHNHANLHHLDGWELKQLVSFSTNSLSKIKYISRLDFDWTLHFLRSHSLKYIMDKVTR